MAPLSVVPGGGWKRRRYSFSPPDSEVVVIGFSDLLDKSLGSGVGGEIRARKTDLGIIRTKRYTGSPECECFPKKCRVRRQSGQRKTVFKRGMQKNELRSKTKKKWRAMEGGKVSCKLRKKRISRRGCWLV